MRGGEGTSGKSGSSPNLCSSGLLRTDHNKQSLSRASTEVVVEAVAVVVNVVEMVDDPRMVDVGKAVVETAVINGDVDMLLFLLLLIL